MRDIASIIVILASLCLPPDAFAQISPGELHRSHAFLEGVDNCNRCHSPKGDQMPDKCLQCHSVIADEQRVGRGLHAQAGYEKCALCHVEHHGRDFDLIYFKGGMEAFDHAATGFELNGRHAALDCRKCHSAGHIAKENILNAQNIDLERTFLGLDGACKNCHIDQHHGQLSDRCQNCHNTTAWKPAPLFDHSKARYALTGRHQPLACEKCHDLLTDDVDLTYRHYAPLEFTECTACHKDAHTGRLGADCSGCHNTAGWNIVSNASFDHSKTRYPLEGRHARVACESCHGREKSDRKLKFASCTDCHGDYHKESFVNRESKGACEECHTVTGFKPARFSIEQHAKGDFALLGAHLAVPCDLCHRRGNDDNYSYKFTFASTACRECHRDPHQGQVDKFVSSGGCESCHAVEDWHHIQFDHAVTSFALAGKHRDILCRACHKPQDAQSNAHLKFAPLAKNCAGCHADPHRNQFAALSIEDQIDCASCHALQSWKELAFDHNKNSRFPLDGAHIKVPCGSCHLTVADEAGGYVVYKPVDSRCVACHAHEPDKMESLQ